MACIYGIEQPCDECRICSKGRNEKKMNEIEKNTMEYENPIPVILNDYVSKEITIRFLFEKYVTKEEALRGINEMLIKNGGKITEDWLILENPTITAPKQKIWNMERSVTDYGGGWIPCSERLPEKNGTYLVTYRDDLVGIYVIERKYYNGKFEPMPYSEKHTGRKALAWQPFPEPYKPQ